MEFLQKLGDAITTTGKTVTDKAKETAEIVNLKSQINACENVIKKNYMELGKIYYNKNAMEPGEEYAEACKAIENAQNAIVDLENQLKAVKGV